MRYTKFPNYEFYEDGTIYGYVRKKYLRGNDSHKGYNMVGLNDNNGIKKIYQRHRIIYTIFKGEIPEGYDVHHINHNKQDNRIDNLEIITHSQHSIMHNQNMTDSHKNKLRLGKLGSLNPQSKKVRLYYDDVVEDFDTMVACANKIGVSTTTVLRVIKNNLLLKNKYKIEWIQ